MADLGALFNVSVIAFAVGYPIILSVLKSSIEKGEDWIERIERQTETELRYIDSPMVSSKEEKRRDVLETHSTKALTYVRQLWQLRSLQAGIGILAIIPVIIMSILLGMSYESSLCGLQRTFVWAFLIMLLVFFSSVVIYGIASGYQYRGIYEREIPKYFICHRKHGMLLKRWELDASLMDSVLELWEERLRKLKQMRIWSQIPEVVQ